jgi:hypothetical protein
MTGGLSDLVVRPGTFFDRAVSTPSLAGPATLSLALGLLGVARLLLLFDVLRDLPGTFGGPGLVYAIGRLEMSAPLELAVGAVLVTGFFALGWLLVTAVVYATARALGHDGSKRDLLVLVGWAQIPTLFPVVVGTLFVLAVTLQAPDLTTRAAAREWALTAIAGNPAYQAVRLVSPLAALWSGYLWLLATERVFGLSRRRALACVALPAALLVVNSLGGFVSIGP